MDDHRRRPGGSLRGPADRHPNSGSTLFRKSEGSVHNRSAAATLPLRASLQKLGEQLLRELGLVGQDHMVGIVDQLDPRLGQLLSEAGCRLWSVVAGVVPA